MRRRVLAGLAIVIALAVIGYFAVDETLAPETAALLDERKPSLPDADNAWFMLVGLTARPEENALEFAREWTTAAREVRSARGLEAFEARFAPRRIPLPAAPTAPQSPHLGLVLKRYAALYEYQGFEEPLLGSAHSPMPYGPEYGYSWAKERTLEKALLGGEFRGALKALWQDTDLQRRMLAGSAYFHSKALFTVTLARNYLAASAIIRASPQNAQAEAGALRELLSPLTAEELGIEKALASQVRLVARAARERGFPYSLVSRPNAAANGAARRAREDFAEIIARMDDLEALRRLVTLQLEASVSRTLPPVSAPLRHDPDKQQVYFEPRSARFRELGRDGRIAVAVPLV